MKKIIPPVDKELIKAELTQDKLLRETNKAGNQIYIVTGQNSPNVMREIGRLREIAFRDGGGGTGMELDIDKFDTDPAYGYKQMVLWDPEAEKIVGGYRYVLCDEIVYTREGQPILTSSHMFHFTKHFIKHYIPHTIELGRSFVSVEYQSTKAGAKSIFALDNLFDGLGALMVLHKGRMKYFFGKMTIYNSYPKEARELIQVFLNKHFPMVKQLIKLRKEVKVGNSRKYRSLLTSEEFKEDYKNLKTNIAAYGVNIPPLVNSYMNLSEKMIYLGTGVNDEFADVFDSGILIPFADIAPAKVIRHMDSLKESFKKLKNKLKKKF
ncbi:MAG: GNAT family N-acetyltransferase [Bacteroidales bacterium]|nr:GNAT family N-acetyltransferase [Bacteroidales bacterium]